MVQLQNLIKPTWSVEKALNNAWAILNDEEKIAIQKRMDQMFYNELPFQLEHEKIVYIHLFSLFAQLEAFALRGLIKTLDSLAGTPLYEKMRQQIVDEVFHTTVFAKLAYQLSAPYALPLGHNQNISYFISTIESEDDLATFVTLINLVGEGWVEEMMTAMVEKKVAVNVFETILEDESRHLDEYELYREVGMPDKEYVSKKLSIFEDDLIKAVFSQKQYVMALVTLLGGDGVIQLIDNINKKQHWMLEKINLKPTENWQFFMNNISLVTQTVFYDSKEDKVLEPTNMRKLLSAVWRDPELPTQSSVFSINVTPVCFFEKKFKSETITCLMLQALSQTCFNNPQTRIYMFNNKLYNSSDCYVGLAVKLPECGDQLGVIEFKNCHDMSMLELAQHIRHDMSIMTYCYKKTQMLKTEHPYLCDVENRLLSPRNEQVYNDPLFLKPGISLSNIGHWGYETPVSPLFPNETAKFTLAKIERKQVWNTTTNQFEVQDILPVGLSVDHRVFDANIPVPYYMQAAFDQMFIAMEQSIPKSYSQPFANLDTFIESSNKIIEKDLELGFLYLFYSAQVWSNFSSYDGLMKKIEVQK